MNFVYINRINPIKRYYIIICIVVFIFLSNWVLRDLTVNTLFPKLIIYLLFCSSLYVGLIIEKDWFSPFSIFSLFFFCLFIYNSEVCPYFLPPLSLRSIALILLGSSSFILGMVAFKNLRIKLRSNKNFKYQEQSKQFYSPKYSYWILLVVGLTPTIISTAIKGVPAITVEGLSGNEIQEVRASFFIPILSMLSCLTNVALITVMSTKRKKQIIFVLIIVLISSSMIFAKLDLMFTIFFASYGVIKYKLVTRKTSSLILIIGTVLIFFGLSQSYRYARGGEAGKLYTFEKNYISYGSKYYSENLRDIYLTYMYMVTPFSNLDYIFENFKNYTNGKMSFWSLISISQIKRIYGLKPLLKPIRVWPFNTHTFLADFYMDFGILGVLLMPFILGVSVYYFYSRTFLSNDPLIISIYLYWGLATLMMFFSNHFTSVGYPLHYLIVIEMYRKTSNLLEPILRK
jgi:oligosaccharide repeat unit polymerase